MLPTRRFGLGRTRKCAACPSFDADRYPPRRSNRLWRSWTHRPRRSRFRRRSPTRRRQTLEKAKAEAVAAERTKAYGERMRLDTQLQDLQRRLQRNTANELGKESEVDVFEALRRDFPHDTITRVAKGVPGADIIHRIIHNDTVTGTILVDSRNTSRFLSRYATKLRTDQHREQADHAIISTPAFPPGRYPARLIAE
jgi:hypothetical protein